MTQQKRLGLVLGLNLIMITGLVVVGISSHSLAVLAAGGEFAVDSIAILLGILAIQIAKHPHGRPNATTFVALINALALLAVSAFVLIEGVRRLTSDTPHIEGLSVLIVSVVAAIIMSIAAVILGKDSGNEDLHMRSVLLDTVADGIAAAAVAVSGGVIYLTGRFQWLDSALSVLISLVIGFGALVLLRDVVRALRAKTALKVN